MRREVKIGLVVGIVLILLGAWWMWPSSRPESPSPEEVRQALVPAEQPGEPIGQPVAAEAEPSTPAQERSQAEPSQPTIVEPAEVPEPEKKVAGTLLTATGATAEEAAQVGPTEVGGANVPLEAPAVPVVPPAVEQEMPAETPEPTAAPVESAAQQLPAEIGSQPLVHVVLPGESIAKIAERYYGSQKYADFLLKANPHVGDPRRMPVGTKLTIPPLPADLRTASPGESRAPGVASAVEAPERYRTYTVRKGDTFYSIAERLLGDASRWRELLRLNSRLVHGDPRNLRAGQVIKVPAK